MTAAVVLSSPAEPSDAKSGRKKDVFLENSQGLYFFYNPQNAFFSKILRAIILVLATYGAIFVCVLNSKRYIDSITQTVVEETDMHISSIDFPAVTICPIKITASNFTQEAVKYFLSGNASAQEIRVLFKVVQTIQNHINEMHFEDSEITNHDQEFIDNKLNRFKFRDLVKFLSVPCLELFKECTWRRIKKPCCEILQPQRAYGNMCFSFNSMLVENPRQRAWRVPDSGKRSALQVVLNKKVSQIGKVDRVAIIIHDPLDIPLSNIIQMEGQRTTITIDPLHFVADPEIENLSPEYRRCFFRGEVRPLGTTRSHCIQLCRRNYIFEHCNCTLDMDFPNGSGGGSCNLTHFKCLYEHRYALSSSGKILIPLSSEDDESLEPTIYNCQCYQNCNYVQYKAAIQVASGIDLDENKTIDLHVHFTQDTLFSYRTSFIFTFLDLLVSYGGVAGLFLGFSFVGAVEVLQQFFSIRKEKIKKKISFRRLKQRSQQSS